jgi:hypothetical protein
MSISILVNFFGILYIVYVHSYTSFIYFLSVIRRNPFFSLNIISIYTVSEIKFCFEKGEEVFSKKPLQLLIGCILTRMRMAFFECFVV